jgi:hypothetical protein
MNVKCEFCQAYHWIDELPTGQEHFEDCCKKGDVNLEPLKKLPYYIRDLYKGQHTQGHNFQQQIQAYNSALAFTSVSYTQDKQSCHGGVQVFRIQGQLFHYQGPLQPGSQETPQFAQLFFHDTDQATNIRAGRNPNLDRGILGDLHMMLHNCNPFIAIYKTADERLQTQSNVPGPLQIVLSPKMELVICLDTDRQQENLPTNNKVVAIIPDEYKDSS